MLVVGVLLAGRLLTGFGGTVANPATAGWYEDAAWRRRKKRLEDAIRLEAEREALPEIRALPEPLRAPALDRLDALVAMYSPPPQIDMDAIAAQVDVVAAQIVAQWREQQRRRGDDEIFYLLLN